MSIIKRLLLPALAAAAAVAMCFAVTVSPAPAADKNAPVYRAEAEQLVPTSPWTTLYGSLGIATGALSSDFGFGVDGYGVSGRVGADVQINKMVIGVFGDVQFDRINAAGTSLSGKEYGVAARAGFLPADNVLVYGLAGEKWLSVSGANTQGLWTGGGIEVALTKHWKVGAEYGHITWDDIPAAREQTMMGRLIFAFPVAGMR